MYKPNYPNDKALYIPLSHSRSNPTYIKCITIDKCVDIYLPLPLLLLQLGKANTTIITFIIYIHLIIHLVLFITIVYVEFRSWRLSSRYGVGIGYRFLSSLLYMMGIICHTLLLLIYIYIYIFIIHI